VPEGGHVNLEPVHKVADAILYEGYLLYPYRPSSVKNRQRWTFGGLYPASFAARTRDASSFETQLLVAGSTGVLDIELRFLHLRSRALADGGCWQEAAARSVLVGALTISELMVRTVERRFAFSKSSDAISQQEHIQGSIEISVTRAGETSHKLTIRVSNETPIDLPENATRDDASMFALVAAHAIVTITGGEFISLTDPPDSFRDAAALCSNTGVWPVLAGDEGSHDCVLASPIILSDYPQIAPESPGDLFDGAEIDEILTLRILTLTDDEKEAMRNADERARQLLERTEALTPENLMKLHGALRDPHWSGAARRNA
ncbi:MAG: hypothetical protein ACXWAV_06325, partial [Chthoniobacterales bacterium]